MKMTIVGMGRVGSAIAFATTMNPMVSELLLVNRTLEKAQGEALDLTHASALNNSNLKISAGTLADSAQSDLIIFTASQPLGNPPRSRLALAAENLPLLQDYIPALAAASPQALFVMVTNPVDVATYLAIRLSGFPPHRIIGTGTLVDSVRYRALLSQELQIHADDIRAYILGEHGDSQFAAHSIVMTGGERFYPSDTSLRLFQQTVSMGFEVYKLKGHTCYAIALATMMIIDSIVYDLRHTMPVSTLIDGYLGCEDVCLSLPAVIGRSGVTRILHPTLADDEREAFRRSARTVREVIEGLPLAGS